MGNLAFIINRILGGIEVIYNRTSVYAGEQVLPITLGHRPEYRWRIILFVVLSAQRKNRNLKEAENGQVDQQATANNFSPLCISLIANNLIQTIFQMRFVLTQTVCCVKACFASSHKAQNSLPVLNPGIFVTQFSQDGPIAICFSISAHLAKC